jgi:predicted dehydrogenase
MSLGINNALCSRHARSLNNWLNIPSIANCSTSINVRDVDITVEEEATGKMVTAAIIGAGAMAREHIASLRRLENIRITGVCDLSPARAEATAERYGIEKWYVDYQIMLHESRPDIVHIVTPPETHFQIAYHALGERIHVLCEKPITTTYEEFKVLRDLAESVNCLLVEDQNYRFHSSVLRMNEFFKKGLLGEIIDVQAFISLGISESHGEGRAALEKLKGGIIGDFLPHISYLLLMYVGAVRDLHTVWSKRDRHSVHQVDEFRSVILGERAFGYAGFSGNLHADGFWLRLRGTRMDTEANLFEPPRLITKHRRPTENALNKFVDGIDESRQVISGTFGSLWRKLAGGSYDGLDEFIVRTYRALEGKPPPVTLDQIEETSILVTKFTDQLVQL